MTILGGIKIFAGVIFSPVIAYVTAIVDKIMVKDNRKTGVVKNILSMAGPAIVQP